MQATVVSTSQATILSCPPSVPCASLSDTPDVWKRHEQLERVVSPEPAPEAPLQHIYGAAHSSSRAWVAPAGAADVSGGSGRDVSLDGWVCLG